MTIYFCEDLPVMNQVLIVKEKRLRAFCFFFVM